MTSIAIPDDELGEAQFRLTPPRYGAGSIGDVMSGACAALGVPDVADPLGLAERHPGLRRAIVLLIDGLGHHQLPLLAPLAPTLTTGYAHYDVLTAGFPSTTPASIVGLGTGAPTGQHGILAFTVRVPGTDVVLNHIRWQGDPAPDVWQPVPTLFERARAAGVATRAVSRPQFAGSGLTIAAYRGADYVGVDGVPALAETVLDAARTAPEPTLVYAYDPDLDHAGHLHGVGSPEWFEAAAEAEELVARVAAALPDGSALFVTADHGQLNVPWHARPDIDTDARLQAGVAIVAGEPRVRYLHTLPGATEDVIAAWRGVLGGSAIVMSRTEAVETGWYGEIPAEHLERLGDVIVVCLDRTVVVATRADPRTAALVAYHGSLTAAEMEIPLLTF